MAIFASTKRKPPPVQGFSAKVRRRSPSPLIAYGLAVIASVIVAISLHSSVQLSRSRALSEVRLQVSAELGQLRARLEDNIYINVNILQGLSAVVATEPGIGQERFAQLAKQLLAGRNQIRNVAAAPDLVVRLMYPVEGNEAAIGLDYTKNAEQRTGAMRAIESKEVVVVGPLNLVQGGRGLIARFPVFGAESTKRPAKVWGVVSTVIDVPRLFSDSGITESAQTINIGIRRKSTDGNAHAFFHGAPGIADQKPVVTTVSVPGGDWELIAVPKQGWPTAAPDEGQIIAAYLIGGAFIVIPLLIVGRLQAARRDDDQAHDAYLERLRKLEEIGRVGGWYVDRATYNQTLTPGMFAILEISSTEEAVAYATVRGLHSSPEAVKHPELREGLLAAMTHGRPFDITLETQTAKGRPIWLHLRAEPVFRDGEVIGLSGYSQDITLQHQLKEKAMASQKMEAIGQLTAGIAHDFNNLLAAISLNVDLIANETTTPTFQSQRALVAKNACDRGAKLTRQLLAFARKQSLLPRRHDLCALVANSAVLLKHTLPTNIAVQVVAGANLAAWAEIDQAQFDVALLNLGLNARDAMPDGGLLLISVVIREIISSEGTKTLRPGRYAVVSVRDTGSGMSADVLARACDPFFTTKQSGQGSGLGLSMVHGFVCQSGGDVEIHSRSGEGTSVEMLFPLVERAHAIGDEPMPAIRGIRGCGRRVLLAEDMDDVREACQIHLESLGFTVVSVPTGAAARRLIDSGECFEILMTDLDMPGGVDGNHLAEFASAAIPGLKIITMTGYNEGRLKSRSETSTSDRRIHLQKPFSCAKLEDALRHLVGPPVLRRVS